MKTRKLPKGLGIKIGTDEQVMWDSVVRDTKETIKQLEKALTINKAILEMAESKVAAEIEKLK